MAEQRRRQRRKAARPSEIIDAGMALFALHGFEGTKLSEVARQAGIVKGTIYLYFDSKEALFEAALQDRMAKAMESAIQRLPDLSGSTEAQLRSFLGTIYGGMIGGDALVLFKIMLREGHRFPRLLQLYRNVAISSGVALLNQILRTGAARGELRIEPASFDPRLIVAPALVSALWAVLFPDEKPMATPEYAAAHLDMVLHGILAAPAPPGDSATPSSGGDPAKEK